MRLLVLASVLALLMAGCLSASQNQPVQTQTTPPPPVTGLAVYTAGATVPMSPEDVVGTTPNVVGKLIGARGAENNVGVTSSGAIFISAFDFVYRSKDMGDTWEAVHEFGDIHPPAGRSDPISDSDPMLWVDHDTDRVFSPVMWPALVCASGAYSDDDGNTWSGAPVACGLPPPMDHQKFATGPFASGSPLKPNPATGYPNAVYFCYNQIFATNCAVSIDGGLTFPYAHQAIQGNCGGINGMPKARDTDGAVFVPAGVNCNSAVVAVSKDNGLTWEVKTLDVGDLGMEELDPAIAVSPAGTLFYMFRAAKDHLAYYVSSTDDFSTVSKPHRINPPDVHSTRFAGIVAGDEGKVAFAYLGTRDTDKAPAEAPDNTRWHLFTTFTFDALAEEPTFVTQQVTPPEDPVQVGYMWEGGGGDPGRNLLDFIDMVADKDGRVYVAYADGCVDDCVKKGADAKPADSRAREAAVAVLESGPMLFEKPMETWGTMKAAPLVPGLNGL